MRDISAVSVMSNVLLYFLWSGLFNMVLERRYKMPVMLTGEALFCCAWIVLARVFPQCTLMSVCIAVVPILISEMILFAVMPRVEGLENGIMALSTGEQIYTYVIDLLFPLGQIFMLDNWFRIMVWKMLPGQGVQIAVTVVCIAADTALLFTVRSMAQKERLKAENALLASRIAAQQEHYAALTAQSD